MSPQIGTSFSADTLDRAPSRVTQFLLGLCDQQTFAAMHANGMRNGDLERAEQLLAQVRPRLLPEEQVAVPQAEAARRAALLEVAQLDERLLAKLPDLVALESPPTAEWLFGDLSPKDTQAESMVVVETVITRFDALESGDAPDHCDPSVLDRLAERGFDAAERERVALLVRTARTPVAPEAGPAEPVAQPSPDELAEAKQGLHLWWRGMAAIARTAGLKKSQLIRLGLARRATPAQSTGANDVASDVEADDG